MNASRFDLVTLDTAHTELLAKFWAAVLDLIELGREDGDRWIVLGERGGLRRLGFQRAAGACDASRLHLDLTCDQQDFDGEVARLVALGATLLSPARTESYGSIANLVDPDGNLFDLCAYS